MLHMIEFKLYFSESKSGFKSVNDTKHEDHRQNKDLRDGYKDGNEELKEDVLRSPARDSKMQKHAKYPSRQLNESYFEGKSETFSLQNSDLFIDF